MTSPSSPYDGPDNALGAATQRALVGNLATGGEKLAAAGKLFVRDRISLLLDDGTFGQEGSFEEEGFWLRGGAEAEVVLQALTPPRAVRLLRSRQRRCGEARPRHRDGTG